MTISPVIVAVTIVLGVLAIIGGGIAQVVLFKIQQRKQREHAKLHEQSQSH